MKNIPTVCTKHLAAALMQKHSFCCNHTLARIHRPPHTFIMVHTVFRCAPAWARAPVCVRTLSYVYALRERPCFRVFRAPEAAPRGLTVRAFPAAYPDVARKAVARDDAALSGPGAKRTRRGAGGCGYGRVHSLLLPPSLPSSLPPSLSPGPRSCFLPCSLSLSIRLSLSLFLNKHPVSQCLIILISTLQSKQEVMEAKDCGQLAESNGRFPDSGSESA